MKTNCLTCEVIRARILARYLKAQGFTVDDAARQLTLRLNAYYIVDNGVILRSNKPTDIVVYRGFKNAN